MIIIDNIKLEGIIAGDELFFEFSQTWFSKVTNCLKKNRIQAISFGAGKPQNLQTIDFVRYILDLDFDTG